MTATLRLFGSPVLLLDGHPVAGPAAQRHRLALLALLAGSRDQVLGRERATALLWPEAGPSQARRLLNVSVYELRRTLGWAALVTVNGDLRLDRDHLAVDLLEFDAALARGDHASAVDRHRAPLLDGFFVPGSEEFEKWADAERERCLAGYRAALEALAVEADRRESPLLAVERWQLVVAADPYRTRAVMGLMEAMAAAGEPALALKVAREHATRLERELAARPDPSIRDLVLRLERRAGLPAAAPGISTPTEPARVPVAPRQSSRAIWLWLGFAATVLAGVGLLRRATEVRESPGPTTAFVHPFDNLTGRPDLDPVGAVVSGRILDGILSTGVAALADSGAVARSRRGAGNAVTVTGSYHLAHGDLVLEGQVRLDGRVVAGLHARGRLDDPATAIDEVRTRTLGAIALALDRDVAGVTGTAGTPPTYPAYVEFAAGLERPGPASLPRFIRAATLDTTFVLPLLWAAYWAEGCGGQCGVRLDSVLAVLDRRRDALSIADRHGVDLLSAVLAGDRDRALELGRRAAVIAPRSPWAEKASYLALDLGHPEEALALLEPLLQPGSWARRRPGLWARLGMLLHWTGAYRRQAELATEGTDRQGPELAPNRLAGLAGLGEGDRVLEEFDRLHQEQGDEQAVRLASGLIAELRAHGAEDAAQALARRCAGAAANVVQARGELAECLIHEGRYAEARQVLEHLRDTAPGWAPPGWIHGRLGMLAALTGDRPEAERYRALLGQSVHQGLHANGLAAADALGLAMVATALNEPARARFHLEQAFARSRNWELLARDPGIFPFERLATVTATGR